MVRLTADGLSLLAAEAVVFFAAFNTGANLVYVIGSMILALFAVSAWYALRGFKGLTAHVSMPPEVPEGQAFPYHVKLTNRGGGPLFLLRVSPRFGKPVDVDGLPVFRIDAGESASLDGSLTLPVRGAYPAAGLAVQSVYPAGLIAREQVLPSQGEVVVLPGALKHPFPVFPGFNQRAVWAETGSNVKGAGSAFYGLREYVPGDQIRKIHWKATARAGRPMVTEEEEDRINRYFVFVDLRESRKVGEGRSSNLEVSIRVSAALTLQLLKLNCPVRVHLLDASLSSSPPGYTARDIPAAMRFLGRLGYTQDADFARSVHRALPDIPPGSYLLFVLTGADAESVGLVQSLRRGGFGIFCLFNLPNLEAVRAARETQVVRDLLKTDVQTVFFDASEEKVVTL